MKFAICNETFEQLPLSNALQQAKAAGYTGWEVAPFMLGLPVEAIPGDQRKAYRDTVGDAGLEIIGLHWLLAKTEGFHLTTEDHSVRKATADYLVQLGHLCHDLGGDVMVLGSPQQRNFPPSMTESMAMENAAEVLRLAAPAIGDLNVRIAVEPLGRGEGNFLNTADKGRELIERVDAANVRLHLDVKAMSDEEKSVPEIIRENADLTIHFHANDPNLKGPGMGEVDFSPIMSALQQTGYDGWVSVEVFDYSPGVDAILNQSMKTLQASLT